MFVHRVGNYPQNLLSADSDIRRLFFADTLRISDIKKSIILPFNYKKIAKISAPKFFASFEGQKKSFWCLFWRENLKICEKLDTKFLKFTQNGTKIQKINFLDPKICMFFTIWNIWYPSDISCGYRVGYLVADSADIGYRIIRIAHPTSDVPVLDTKIALLLPSCW